MTKILPGQCPGLPGSGTAYAVKAVLDSIHKDDIYYLKGCKSVRFFRSADGTPPVSVFTKESVVFQLPSLLGPVQNLDTTVTCMYYLCMSNANVLSHGSNWPDALRLSLGVTKITFIHSLFHIRVSGEPGNEAMNRELSTAGTRTVSSRRRIFI